MKQFIVTIILIIASAATVEAQEERSFLDPMFDEKPAMKKSYIEEEPNLSPDMRLAADEDSLYLPPLTMNGQMMPIGRMPYGMWGWNSWNLHSGLNVNMSATVMAGIGRHRRSGAGFGQSIAAVYAMPLSNKLSIAIGGYINNMNWGNDHYVEGGISGILTYRFNDKLEAYIYAQKALTNRGRMAPYPYGWGYNDWNDWRAGGDRIGAGVRYAPNPSFTLEVQVEAQRLPRGYYYDYYPYYPPYWGW